MDGGDVRRAEEAMRAERVAVRGADSCESARRARTCGQEKGGLGAMVALAARWRALAPSPVLS